jgi:hypothetical protein
VAARAQAEPGDDLAQLLGLRDPPGGDGECASRLEHALELTERAVLVGEEHHAEAAQHAVEGGVREIQVLRILHAAPRREAPPRRLLIGETHHFLGQVDAERLAGFADAFGGREKHRPAAARYVEDTLAGGDAGRLDEAPAEIGEAPGPRVAARRNGVEKRPGLRLSLLMCHGHNAGEFLMLALPKNNLDRAHAAARIKAWTRRRFRLGRGDTIFVTELEGGAPGFPPLRTIVSFWIAERGHYHFTAFKPLEEVREEDVPPSWYLDALAVEAGVQCGCC